MISGCAIAPIPDIVEHLHRRGGRLGARDGGKNHEASGDKDWEPDTEHCSLAGESKASWHRTATIANGFGHLGAPPTAAAKTVS
jgi:hypothetical protein